MRIDQSFIESVIREIIREELSPAKDPVLQRDISGVMCVSPADCKLQKFPFTIESDRVLLADLLTLEESPRLGCGLMELDHTAFSWTLSYDEVDYIIEGTLDIVIDGRRVRAKAGEVIFIPKNTKIEFSTPDKTRFLYVCYPANWSEQT